MDDIDRAIIAELRADSRAPYAAIGAEVGLSASATKRRVDRMVADRTIRRFTVDVDPAAEGAGTEAYVELFCRGTIAPHELRRMLLAIPEVVEAGTVTGEADAVGVLRAAGDQELEQALEKVRAAGSVDHTKSSVVLSRLITR
ncbi:Lrp/AsnC family transcriptional regulator [Aestuariimicrobium ganziense]|uniref:Lrp/AsnC family transcriptional regulator n=1 Tax=Aestuariimicrobium ganziense TaxID=2773677 RepID=UPI00194077FE|nr:Lrp/AsnC family transcriptional regulator [Aestuariimicrobium ganziense]